MHRKRQIVEVGNHIVNGADRAASLGGEVAGLQPGKPARRDGPLGGGDQGGFKLLFSLAISHFNHHFEQRSKFCLTTLKEGLGCFCEHCS